MEIHARTGGRLINEEIYKPYLRKKRTNERPPIRFEKLKKVEEDRFRLFEDTTIKETPKEYDNEEYEINHMWLGRRWMKYPRQMIMLSPYSSWQSISSSSSRIDLRG